MSPDEDLILSFILDGEGGGSLVDWDGVRSFSPEQGVLWVHLQREAAGAREWLENESGLSAVLCEALLSDESRPRCEPHGDGLLLGLRGVNLNPESDPEDMIALMIWADANRIVTVRRRPVMAVRDVRVAIEDGDGPVSSGGFVARIANQLVDRMGPVISELDDAIDGLEADILDGETATMRRSLGGLRRQAIALRRYIAPQRDAMTRLMTQQLPWIAAEDRFRLREVADRITRYVEDLDAARERAQIIQDELVTQVSEQMNRNMYTLSIVAAIFLPLGLLTGLLGINVGGIPGDKWPMAFWFVSGLLIVLAVFEIWLFRRLKWL